MFGLPSETEINEMFGEFKISEPEEENRVEVKKIIGHNRSKLTGIFTFKIKFVDGTIEDVSDLDCSCESVIRNYMEEQKLGRTVYCVCRVSSKQQVGPRHVSLKVQELRLKKEAGQYGKNVRTKVVQMSASAYKGIPRMLEEIGECAREGDVIMIYRVDRLSRNIVKYLSWLEDLMERGVEVVAVDENITYRKDKLRFIQCILDANRESEMIGKRVRASIQHRRERGDEWIGGRIPKGKKLVWSDERGCRVLVGEGGEDREHGKKRKVGEKEVRKPGKRIKSVESMSD